MSVDPEVLEHVCAVLAESDHVDTRRIKVDSRGADVVLRGAVATPE